MQLKAILTSISIALFSTTAAHAAPVTGAQVNYRINSSTTLLTIHKNGSYTVSVRRIIQPLNATGVQAQSQVNIAYPGNFATLKILKAYTENADGTRHAVVPSEIFRLCTPSAIKAPFLSDGVNESVIFPDVAPGDTLHIRYDLTYAHPYLPGIYAVSAVLNPAIAIQHAAIGMDMVKDNSMKIYKAKAGTGWQSDSNGFTATHDTVSVPPLGTPSPSQYAGLAVLSTVNSWAALARAYDQLADPAMRITPAVRAAAEQAAGGQTGDQAIVPIFHWIQKNIHTVSVDYRTAGFAPMSATETLARGMGDSNAKVALTCAMLHVVGVYAVPAMVSNETRFKEYPGVDPFAFDHFLVYLPAQHRFLDVSARHASATALPIADAGRPVLITGKNPSMVTTPVPYTNSPVLSEVEDLSLHGNGELAGTELVTANGYAAQQERAAISGLRGRRLLKRITDSFYSQGNIGDVDRIEFRNRFDLEQPFAMRAHIVREGKFVPGKIFSLSLPEMHPVTASLLPFASNESRSTPSVVDPTNLHFQLSIHIPSGYHPLYLPDSESLNTCVGDYSVTYAFKNGIFTESESLVLPEFLIRSDQFPMLRKITAMALEENKQALVLEKSA
ncbi:MAG: DUF3857 domain-containing protein [Acidithiobacillus sp.]